MNDMSVLNEKELEKVSGGETDETGKEGKTP